MDVVIPPHSGFCPGVKHAERLLFKHVHENPDEKPIVLGQLIHNARYVSFLESKGIHTVAEPDQAPRGAVLALRTHGVERHREEEARKHCSVIDLTCEKVKRLQNEIAKKSSAGAFVYICGKASHPETLALRSYAARCRVLETDSDLEALEETLPRGNRPIFVVSQTTGDHDFFRKAAGLIRKRRGSDVEVFDSICPITSLREEEALLLQERADMTVVVGDKGSANANKLFNVLREKEPIWFVEDLEDLRNSCGELAGHKTALVVSSSSTPEFVEKEIVDFLRSLR